MKKEKRVINKLYCQCPKKSIVLLEEEHLFSEEEKSGMNHEPNECKGTNKIIKYRRGNKELYLCSCCKMPGDIILSL